ncbi:MAG TPA: hypothetical protein VNN08_08315 [Thermoanaerobaculia bacterium]|nr:hypothetical protein [Thermoanaerobaculia bacterium]
MMQYRAEDFPLYLLGLVLAGTLIAPALPSRSEQLLLVAALLYMVAFFLIKHGAKFEVRFFHDVLEGLTRYPVMLVRNWWMARHAIIPITGVFLLALTGERFLRPALAGTKWLNRFPWWWVVWTAFLLITLFRVTILIAHLLRASVVREVLEDSAQKKMIEVLPMHQHILHAFITGMLAHLSVVAPCVLFYMLTKPSNLREVLLVAGYVVWSGVARPLKKRKIIESPPKIGFNLVYQNHTIAHRSRFFFTVFHGHHHDAIPSALIGSAGGTGFFENVDRGLTWLDFLNSVVVMQILWGYSILFDMVVHQYIPGVFPFAKVTVLGTAHHVTHHFGSALPLGLIFNGYIETRDYDNGYKSDNKVTRWFVDQVERREGLDPELRRKYLAFGPTTSSLSSDASTRAAAE